MHLVLLWLTLSVFVLPLSLPVMIGSVCPLFGCHGHRACVCHCLSCSCCVSAVLRAIVLMPVMYGMKTLCHRCQPSKTTKTGRPTNTAHRSVDVARSWPSINTHIRFGTSPRRHLNPSTTCQFVFSFRCMQRRETTLWLDSSQANNVTNSCSSHIASRKIKPCRMAFTPPLLGGCPGQYLLCSYAFAFLPNVLQHCCSLRRRCQLWNFMFCL